MRLLRTLAAGLLAVAALCAAAAAEQAGPRPPKWVGIYSTSGKAGLKWTRTEGAARYRVYRTISSGKGYTMVAATTDVSFIDADVRPGETYYYVLKSVDAAGAESAFSDERYIKIPVTGGGQPVKPPEWVGALVEEKRIKLAWLPSPSANALAYNIYRSPEKDRGFQLIGSTQDTSFIDTDVREGQTYYYALTTLDKEFKETKFGEPRQVSYELPAGERPRAPRRAEVPEAAPEKIIAKPTKIVLYITKGKDKLPLNSPTDIDIGPDGLLYVSDTGSCTIQIFNRQGEYLRFIGGRGKEDGKFTKLLGLDVDGEGNVYAVDAYTAKLQKFDPKGKLTMAVNIPKDGKAIARDLGLEKPITEFGIVKAVVAPDGRLYVIDNLNHCIEVYSPNGKYIKSFGGHGTKDGEFQGPTFAVFDSAGNICVADCFNARVQVFNADGEFQWKFGSYGNILGTFGRPKGIYIDGAGRIFVADSMSNVVEVFDRDGKFLYLLGDERGRQIDLGTPNGIVMDDKRRIYIVEKLANRVQVRQLGE